ncbi:MAG: hypothetical protein LBC93_04950 [Synergistaceae bacterium]|jgi:hypothetical protein|nr:hypothetical protein [Synergistaceae bacterium]
MVYYYNETHQPGDGMGILRFGSGVNPNNVTVRSRDGEAWTWSTMPRQ